MRWMVLILGLFLSGCYIQSQGRYYAEGPPPLQATSIEQANAMVGGQQPAAYKVGFMEGCDSGRLSAGDNSFLFKKDTDRFDTDDVYQQGWNDGFNRCVSGEGAPPRNYYSQSYYGTNYYYPGTVSTGFYYPGFFYAPGYSIWAGYYGPPRHRLHVHRKNYYYTPWYGGHRHSHRGKAFGGRYNINKPPRGGHKHKGGGRIGGGGRGGGHKGGGGRSGGGGGRYWIR